MKKQTLKKIISSLLIFVFVVSMFQFALPTQAAQEDFAKTGVLSDLYSNPNQNNGKNPYKFALKSVLQSGILQNVIGCTGVVSKVAGWMSKLIQSPKQQAKMAMTTANKVRDQLKSACASTKAGVEGSVGATPVANDLTSTVKTLFAKIKAGLPEGGTVKACQDQVDITSDEMIQTAIDQNKQAEETAIKEQCFDGIAITLAKNQLSAMTRSAMNWVNSGYGGNPFFVQNMTNLTNAIGNNVINTGIDALLSPLAGENPYARDFMTSTVRTQGLRSSSTKFLGGLTSDLENFISSPVSYYSDKTLTDAEKTQMALQRSKDANNAFARDFSVGGWNGWLALTQKPQNNPLGFNMVASQYLADVQAQQRSETQSELAQNNGFLNQKECIKWQLYDKEGKPKMKKGVNVGNSGLAQGYVPVYTNTKPQYQAPDNTHEYGKCTPDGWKITTPGSIIRDKTTNYLNSPERQLELAKTINDSLNALFSFLISKLEDGGLSGLSDGVNNSSNWTANLNLDNYTSPDGNTPYSNNGAYDSFNLTRDLGNNYIYGELINLGTWNASTNKATNTKYTEFPTGFPIEADKTKRVKLYPETPPENYQTNSDNKEIELVSPINAYYEVTTAGNTNLMIEGYNGWAVGDRAFWDGSAWQNWKAGQVNPIKKRGVIQIQQDYIVAGKEILKVLPDVMPKLGKLDYCLPGPNPSYKTNSTDAQSAYQDLIGSMRVTPGPENKQYYGMDYIGGRTYEAFSKIFSDVSYMWSKILKTQLLSQLYDGNYGNRVWKGMNNTVGNDGDYSNDNNYEAPKAELLTKYVESTLDYVNNYQFVNFYEIFDTLMNKHYYDKMTTKYLNDEISIDQEINLNPAYVEMAAAGLDLTKNMLYYNDDIAKATKDYTDAITQAKLNIAKLEPIRTEVSEIIAAAQKRRDDNLLAQINKEGSNTKDRKTICDAYLKSCGNGDQCKTIYNECINTKDKALTKDLYKKIYASCLNEENISFYDPEQITKNGESGNCSDGIDNDGNGLVDMKDPVCLPPTVTIAIPANIKSGGSSIIKWESTKTTTCALSGGKFTGTDIVTGTSNTGVSTGALTTNTSYTVSCTGVTRDFETKASVVVFVAANQTNCKNSLSKLNLITDPDSEFNNLKADPKSKFNNMYDTTGLTYISNCSLIKEAGLCDDSYDKNNFRCKWFGLSQ